MMNHQKPNTKLQTIFKHQTPNLVLASAWCLRFSVSLVFGVWFLVFSPGFWNLEV